MLRNWRVRSVLAHRPDAEHSTLRWWPLAQVHAYDQTQLPDKALLRAKLHEFYLQSAPNDDATE